MTGAELGRSPIRPDAPAGDDIRDQDIFLDLQAEMNRSQSISSGASGVTDWANVQKMATSILEGKSKDLLVAAYLSVAMARKNGPPGVMEGISLLGAMVAEHWDGLFPPPRPHSCPEKRLYLVDDPDAGDPALALLSRTFA